LLSEVGAPAASGQRNPGKPAMVPDRRAESSPAARSSSVSPFAADSARKGGSKPELSTEETPAGGPRIVPSVAATTPVVMGSTAPVDMPQPLELSTEPNGSSPEPEPAEQEDLREAVLRALSGHPTLASMMEGGEWRVEGNDLVIKVAASATVIDMSLGVDARRVAVAAASRVLGRPVKLKVVSGGTPENAPARAASNGSGRSRAEQDPIVRRMKEKFGAEIRTIIDYKDKR
jgi:DNA polymerase-3 subunit gamma/tau